jgi:hypothetical protein
MSKIELVTAPPAGANSPTQQAVARAAAAHDIIDNLGRIITLKKPGVLAQFRIVEIMESSAKNEVYMAMVMPIIFVAAIDGDPVLMPNSKREVEALISRLDDEGVDAVHKGVVEHFGGGAVTPEEADRQKTVIKNS